MDVFDRYAPFIQDYIYEHDWRSLRAVQVAAADAIFNTDENVLLTASTASGKTEAAFFPILTELWEDPPASVGCVYIGPLKALINDQFIRLEDLCSEAGIPVWHWHGDVSAAHKAKMLKHPSGILQITPESLEAMLMHRHAAIPRIFGDLRYVVIDEVHSLLRGDRGDQTLCCIERISRLAGVNPRRIGLSATIGDPVATGNYLSAGTGRGCVIPRMDAPKARWRISMEHFYTTGPQATERGEDGLGHGASVEEEDAEPSYEMPANAASDQPIPSQDKRAEAASPAGATPSEPLPKEPVLPEPEAPTDSAPVFADPGIGYIFEHTRGRKCLVFANSREECEAVTTTLRQYCEAVGEPDRFLIHHGNLSASFRKSAEEIMRDEDANLTTVTTSTLELGIDIGRLERAFQIDAPFTVSSFLQRLGRTGRRGQPQEMWFVMREDEPEARALLPETIPWKLLQGIALVQLYLEERWVEPPRLDGLPYSLLYHQTMATLASSGELTPADLARRVLTLTPFHRVSADDYRVLLCHLLSIDHIQRTDEGGLIVGLAGERVTNNFKFYAVFSSDEEFTVRSESQELGTIVQPPPVGERIAIAGAVWVIEEIDYKRHLIECTQVKGKVPAYFGMVAGDINTRILERMHRVLLEKRDYPYLGANARARLAQARHVAANAHVTDEPLVCLGGTSWCLFPWLGSYAFLALERFLKIRCAGELGLKGLDSSRPYFMQFTMKADAREFYRVVKEQASLPLDPMELVYPGEVPRFDKYDEFVPDELVRKGFAYGVLDVQGMLDRVLSWPDAPRHDSADTLGAGLSGILQ
ncbi:MAG: DEAD/DEAH box helicase [Tractidigestivibacter sp.]|jgi:ATP-dependent Lhr-like helicase|uniref:DEAD/DEAH box helicase n=1 Tax=Tractidigestivibacter sp. TaxID=2847320 RepID=UPI003D8F9277